VCGSVAEWREGGGHENLRKRVNNRVEKIDPIRGRIGPAAQETGDKRKGSEKKRVHHRGEADEREGEEKKKTQVRGRGRLTAYSGESVGSLHIRPSGGKGLRID